MLNDTNEEFTVDITQTFSMKLYPCSVMSTTIYFLLLATISPKFNRNPSRMSTSSP